MSRRTSRSTSVAVVSSIENPVQPSDITGGIMPTITNVVATVNLDCRLDLKTIALHTRNTQYQPKRFHACVMRIREPKTTALIFASGKLVITGARTFEDSRLAARKFARIIQKVGFHPKFLDFAIQNVVASVDTRKIIKLEGLLLKHFRFATWEPELFPGMVYRMLEPKVCMLIFVTGKVVITGAKKRGEIDAAFERIWPVICEFGTVRPGVAVAA